MDAGITLKRDNPYRKAGCFSKVLFLWMAGLFYKGSKKGLEVKDLYKTMDSDRSNKLGDTLEKNWEEEIVRAKKANTKPSLLRALTRTYLKKYMIYGGGLFILYVVLRPYQPVVLAQLIRLFSEEKGPETQKLMYIYASALVGLSILMVFALHHISFGQTSIGMRIRIGITSLIYRKLMRLNKTSLGNTAAGQVVNLLSNDVNRFDLVIIQLHYLWIMPFQVALVTYYIWQEVGISTLAGVLSMACLTLPVQGYLGKLASTLRMQIAKRTDKRVMLMNEVIQGIQVIKMYAWERPFEKLIHLARKREISSLTKSAYLQGVYLSCMVFIERTTLYLTCVCYVLLGNVITADRVFSMAQFFNMLQLAMAIFYPMAISYGAETLVAIKRLEDFLFLEEKEDANIDYSDDGNIRVSKVDAEWVSGTKVVDNLSFTVPKGKLCAIIGPVGSGKSTILQLLLGELVPNTGKISIGGEISYSSQEAWLFSSTVRNNILFGQEYNHLRYKKIVKVCALEKDFQQFPQGDKTMVGERGVSLSGGQRARINLARAIYREADIYILDDPLSAVDTHVGRHLFDECISKYLSDKTRVLITHQLQYLKTADHIIVLDEGKIAAQGTFAELSESNLDFTKMLIASDEQSDEKEEESFEEQSRSTPTKLSRKGSTISCLSLITNSLEMEVLGSIGSGIGRFRDLRFNRDDEHNSYISDNMENEVNTESKIGDEEEIVTDMAPFKEYFRSSKSYCMLGTLICVLILGQACCTGADYWITFWTQEEAVRHSNDSVLKSELDIQYVNSSQVTNTTSELEYITEEISSFFDSLFDTFINDNKEERIIKTNSAIYIYTILIVGAILFTLMRSFLFFKLAMKCSKNLHKRMFHCLLQAPMRFFDTNPSGRVLNRFSKDMGAIDELLPRVMIEAIQITLVMAGILVMVSVSQPYIIIAMVVLGAVFILLRNWYISTAKAIKHIEGITKSPMFSHVNSSLNGLTTIRASKAETSLIGEFDHHQDVHTSSWFLTITCVVSFGLWLDLICVVFVACVTYSFVVFSHFSEVNGSLVGLAISQSLILTGMLQYGMRQTAEVINQLTSVERVLHYTKLDTEKPFETEEGKMPVLPWPREGLIEFKHLFLKYVATDPPVLKDLNIVINPGEKIGIVGRTGAGKSSLISALFRLAPTEGSLCIDGVDTKDLGLRDLRKRISIIPQEPVLFSETLRYNLDPFGEYEDDKLWKALEAVELKDIANSLDFQVSEGGSNFSLGQRQLICLARAIIRNNRVLVLDEATANVDPQTDFLIQKTIRSKFKNCTVLTIAHRLNTIMDSDKVLVMEAGRMVEFDHPHILLQNPDGHFHKMVLETGPSMTLTLKDVALEAYQNTVGAVEHL